MKYFFLSIGIYYTLYRILDLCITNNKYKKLEKNRKNYFIKNIIKSIAMIPIAIEGSYVVGYGILFNKWNNHTMYRLGYQYSALDILGLMTVKKLPLNSQLHHITTFVLSYLNTYIDYNHKTIWIGLPIFCIISCFSFAVNLFLGLRLIYKLEQLNKILNFAYYGYIWWSLFNVLYQYGNIIIHFYQLIPSILKSTEFLLYIFLIHVIINDDIKLIRFLYHHKKKLQNITPTETIENETIENETIENETIENQKNQ